MINDTYFEKPLIIQVKKNATQKVFPCRSCQKFLSLSLIPFCQKCQTEVNDCQHGLACLDCSWSIILTEIEKGSLKADNLSNTQIQDIQRVIQEKFKKEVYLDENNYYRIK